MPRGLLKLRKMTPKSTNAAIILKNIAASLPNNGTDDPSRDARHLLAMALGRTEAVLPHETITVSDADQRKLDALIVRRTKGEPIARIRGSREFYSLDFDLDHSTLDPRADSETLVDAALDWINDHQHDSLSLLDLGTGSGCLALSILANAPNATAVGVDIQADAISMARRNADKLGLAHRAVFAESSWDAALDAHAKFQLIISNPPYIPRPDLSGLMDEVRLYDPMVSLDGGEDGLDEWRKLGPIISRRLDDQGAAIVELGQGQEAEVTAIFAEAGLILEEQRLDLSGIIRCLRFSRR